MEYSFFDRDLSWLSFNYRVLLEAADPTLPLYERINFIAIYSSNLEEFYKVRVAGHKAIAMGKVPEEEETVQSAIELLEQINKEVLRQQEDRISIYEKGILPALEKNHIIFYQRSEVEPFHQEFVCRFFREEIFPYLAPVPVSKDRVITFLRDNRLYLAVRLYRKDLPKDHPQRTEYFVMKLPYSKVPRFIELPKVGKNYYLMFIEDIIKANIGVIFPGYEVDGSYCIKISRDADILIDETGNSRELVEQVKTSVKKRKIGAVCRFMYDRDMPKDFLEFLVDVYHIDRSEWVPSDKHLNLEDLKSLPNPNPHVASLHKPQPLKLTYLDDDSIFDYVADRDLLLYYPYHSFEHFIHFLYEAVHDPMVKEIMVTQYRVANNSAVINTLIAAAQNGKKVTVFVELKARFDEENNLATAEMMRDAGIHIIYSIPKLKVHAKVALVLRRDKQNHRLTSYAYISTGNFNEKTALQYADIGLFTSNRAIVNDLQRLFRMLQGRCVQPVFKRLLVARYNLLPELNRLIDHEIELARSGVGGRIILKMNALQDPVMISRLYEASQAGVQIDLIVRGICCLIPGQTYSRNIRITRIVDTFLEHARVWYFGNGRYPKLFIGSPDWMRRNLYRRIEAVTPILDKRLKKELMDMLWIQLSDGRKACFLDDKLHNCWKSPVPYKEKVRAQYTFYEYIKARL